MMGVIAVCFLGWHKDNKIYWKPHKTLAFCSARNEAWPPLTSNTDTHQYATVPVHLTALSLTYCPSYRQIGKAFIKYGFHSCRVLIVLRTIFFIVEILNFQRILTDVHFPKLIQTLLIEHTRFPSLIQTFIQFLEKYYCIHRAVHLVISVRMQRSEKLLKKPTMIDILSATPPRLYAARTVQLSSDGHSQPFSLLHPPDAHKTIS